MCTWSIFLHTFGIKSVSWYKMLLKIAVLPRNWFDPTFVYCLKEIGYTHITTWAKMTLWITYKGYSFCYFPSNIDSYIFAFSNRVYKMTDIFWIESTPFTNDLDISCVVSILECCILLKHRNQDFMKDTLIPDSCF